MHFVVDRLTPVDLDILEATRAVVAVRRVLPRVVGRGQIEGAEARVQLAAVRAERRVNDEGLLVGAGVDALRARYALVGDAQVVGQVLARVQELGIQLDVAAVDAVALRGQVVDGDEAVVGLDFALGRGWSRLGGDGDAVLRLADEQEVVRVRTLEGHFVALDNWLVLLVWYDELEVVDD